MRNAVTLALIIMAGLVILGPVAAQAYSSNRDKERVAEFYSRKCDGTQMRRCTEPFPPPWKRQASSTSQ
jgi:hypothetical protein